MPIADDAFIALALALPGRATEALASPFPIDISSLDQHKKSHPCGNTLAPSPWDYSKKKQAVALYIEP